MFNEVFLSKIKQNVEDNGNGKTKYDFRLRFLDL